MMVAHHFAEWAGGDARERLVGFEAFALTDLAAPMFAVGVGAAAYLVGRRDSARPQLRRWLDVFALALAIDLAVGGGIDGGGVLLTLGVLGVLVTVLTSAGVSRAGVWWGIAAGCALLAVPATTAFEDGIVGSLLGGSFALPVYGVFAAAGAAVAARAHGGGEAALPLWRAAASVLAVALVGSVVAPDALAPNGLWPPTRHPGDLAFTAWGLAGTLAVWAAIRRLVPAHGRLGAGLARAGRRTLLVFGLHYVVKLVLQHSGHLHELDTFRWGVAVWVAAAVVAAATTIPRRAPAPSVVSSRDGIGRGAAVPVVRSRVRGPGRTGPAPAVLQGGLPAGGLRRPAAQRRGRPQRV
jgi:hypothetical protein